MSYRLDQDPLYLEADAWEQQEMELLEAEREAERLYQEGVDNPEPIGYDEQYDAWDEPRDVREGWE